MGIIGGNADMQLEVLESVTDEDRIKLKELLAAKICTCELQEGTDNLYIDIKVIGKNPYSKSYCVRLSYKYY